MNPLENIKLNREYVAGPLLWTDFHAGGIFFCVPYEVILIFRKDKKVELSQRIIETFRPMDNEDIEFNRLLGEGSYGLTNRNYIECKFKGFKMVGLPLIENPNILAFDSVWKVGFTLKQ